MGAFVDGEWESLSNIFTFESPELGAQFLSHPSSSTFVSHSIDYDNYLNNNPPSIMHPNHSISASNSYENCHFLLNEEFPPMNINLMDQGNLSASFALAFPCDLYVDNQSNDSPIEDNESDNLGSPLSMEAQMKRKSNAPEVEVINAAPKKKARVSKDRSIESKNNEEENVGEGDKSDDESKVSQHTISAAKGKKRASRGTATDPQSLYARRRREKINQRLKILQNLVPNGTKVDISTMLEEAVQYVKFLQLQIRLLSSDDLWMYAPIAYNGVDISVYRRISPFLLP
ncbi:transcription factor RSL3-like [Spinacia oleracea]|uniref:Transcription factor RSL3-like n=1 Tax=Spinacia oleracea TaxID=3562 RepID=A0A9R0IZ62_SPIOL|nr:transcription factor RSL3-like [Spinacia oleracea]